MPKASAKSIIPVERIASSIYIIRSEKVMLDADLAGLYGVETKILVRSMKRNIDRFPEDFSFQLTAEEFESLRCQIGTSNERGGRRYAPYAFTEQGVAMLSGLLKSKKAVQVNVEIMRAFVHMRQFLATNEDLARKVHEHDKQIKNLYAHIEQLLKFPDPPKNPIGYIKEKE